MIPTSTLVPNRSALLISLLAVALCVGAAGSSLAAKSPYEDGQTVQITGVVEDLSGEPIPGITVTLEGSRRALHWSTLEKRKYHPASVSTYTNENGEFTINWRWHHYYNNFELRAVIPVRRAGGNDRPETLTGLLLNERILRGSPVDVPLTVRDTTFLDEFRAFLASLDTNEKRDTYERLGRPDKVDTVDLQDRQEVSWWYFALGKTYRFTDGEITEIVDFDPVPRFADETGR